MSRDSESRVRSRQVTESSSHRRHQRPRQRLPGRAWGMAGHVSKSCHCDSTSQGKFDFSVPFPKSQVCWKPAPGIFHVGLTSCSLTSVIKFQLPENLWGGLVQGNRKMRSSTSSLMQTYIQTMSIQPHNLPSNTHPHHIFGWLVLHCDCMWPYQLVSSCIIHHIS